MKQLFVMDPVDSINPAGDSTYALMLEACRRDWPVWWCTPGHLVARTGSAWATARRVAVSTTAPFFTEQCVEERCLADFDVVWMRKDPPFDINYIFATYLLDLVPPSTLVMNDPAGIRNATEKLYALQWPDLCPTTLATRRVEEVVRFAAAAPGKVVLKPWDGNGGRGVLVSRHGDGNLRAMAEVLSDEGRRGILVQHHVEAISRGDKRIILVEGEPLGWFNRVPQPGDHRGNMHAGARVEACELTERDREICTALAPRLVAEGLLFAGIDVIGDFLTEINVTSPTGIWEVKRLQGRNLECSISDAVAARLAALRAGEPG